MYFTKTPPILKQFSKDLIWSIPSLEKTLYLTFDDGPVPDVTPEILDILDRYGAKATFFCVGENILRHPQIYQDIIKRGHSVGNHTHTHLNGWKNSKYSYLKDFLKCREVMNGCRLFRPPYGKISPVQIQALKSKVKIIMWDVLSGDFDSSMDKHACLNTVIEKSNSGSIIVLHDNLKTRDKVLYALPRILAHFKDFKFENLSEINEV